MIFISRGRTKEQALNYFKTCHGSWYMLDYDNPLRGQLFREHGNPGIPSLPLIDSKGYLISTGGEGRHIVHDFYQIRDIITKCEDLKDKIQNLTLDDVKNVSKGMVNSINPENILISQGVKAAKVLARNIKQKRPVRSLFQRMKK